MYLERKPGSFELVVDSYQHRADGQRTTAPATTAPALREQRAAQLIGRGGSVLAGCNCHH